MSDIIAWPVERVREFITYIREAHTMRQLRQYREEHKLHLVCRCGSRENKKIVHTVLMCAPLKEWTDE